MEKSKTKRVKVKSNGRGKTKEAQNAEKGKKLVAKQPTSADLAAKRIPMKKTQNCGIIYVGHLPHGFFEEELRKFFGQFGELGRVHIERSPRTMGSKGYGFVEFKYREVAEVAASAVNNYMMFGRRLVTDLLPRGVRNFKKSYKLIKGPNGTRTTAWRLNREQQVVEANKVVSVRQLEARRTEFLRQLRKKRRLLEKSSLMYPGIEDILPPIKPLAEEKNEVRKGSSLLHNFDSDQDDEELEEEEEEEENQEDEDEQEDNEDEENEDEEDDEDEEEDEEDDEDEDDEDEDDDEEEEEEEEVEKELLMSQFKVNRKYVAQQMVNGKASSKGKLVTLPEKKRQLAPQHVVNGKKKQLMVKPTTNRRQHAILTSKGKARTIV